MRSDHSPASDANPSLVRISVNVAPSVAAAFSELHTMDGLSATDGIREAIICYSEARRGPQPGIKHAIGAPHWTPPIVTVSTVEEFFALPAHTALQRPDGVVTVKGTDGRWYGQGAPKCGWSMPDPTTVYVVLNPRDHEPHGRR